MTLSTRFKKALCALFVFALLFTLVQPITQAIYSEDSSLATSTYYDYKWWTLWTARDKITTSLSSTSTTKGARSTVLKAVNNTTKNQSYGYSYARELSGEVSLGAKVPVKAIEAEVGVKVSYKTTTTISASVTVPKKTTYYVYKSQDTRNKKYKHIVQHQLHYVNGGWKNSGSASTVYSTWKEKYPTITISK